MKHKSIFITVAVCLSLISHAALASDEIYT